MNSVKVRIAAASAAVALLAAGTGLLLTAHRATPTPATSAAAAASAAVGRTSSAALPTFAVPSASMPSAAVPSAAPVPTAAPTPHGAPGAGAPPVLPHTVRTASAPSVARRPVPTVSRPAPPSTGHPVPPVVRPQPSTPPTPSAAPSSSATPTATVTAAPSKSDDAPPPDAMFGQPQDYNYPVAICDQVDVDALSKAVGYPMLVVSSTGGAAPTGTAAATTSDAAEGTPAVDRTAATGYCSLNNNTDVNSTGPRAGVTAMVQPVDSPYILTLTESSTAINPTPGTGQAYVSHYAQGVYYFTWVDGAYAATVATTQVPDAQAQAAALPVARGLLDWLARTTPAHPKFPAADPQVDSNHTADSTGAKVAAAGAGVAGLIALPGVWLFRRRRS